MNRRGFIGRLFGMLGIAAAPAVAASETVRINFRLSEPSAPQENVHIVGDSEDKYWDAQRHINELEAERIQDHTLNLYSSYLKHGDTIGINGKRFILHEEGKRFVLHDAGA